MNKRYHTLPGGGAGRCRASKKACPYNETGVHGDFANDREAQRWAETVLENEMGGIWDPNATQTEESQLLTPEKEKSLAENDYGANFDYKIKKEWPGATQALLIKDSQGIPLSVWFLDKEGNRVGTAATSTVTKDGFYAIDFMEFNENSGVEQEDGNELITLRSFEEIKLLSEGKYDEAHELYKKLQQNQGNATQDPIVELQGEDLETLDSYSIGLGYDYRIKRNWPNAAEVLMKRTPEGDVLGMRIRDKNGNVLDNVQYGQRLSTGINTADYADFNENASEELGNNIFRVKLPTFKEFSEHLKSARKFKDKIG